MENDFCLYCLWMEGKLLRSNFAQVGAMFEELASCNVLGRATSTLFGDRLAYSSQLDTIPRLPCDILCFVPMRVGYSLPLRLAIRRDPTL